MLANMLIRFLLLISIAANAGKQKRPGGNRKPSILQEYREVLPKDIFAQFGSIYLDKSIKTIEKLRLLDDLFMALPESMTRKLPIPSAFRRLPATEQRRVHRLYYAKGMPFREKLQKLEQFLSQLSGADRDLVPVKPIQQAKRTLGSAERRGDLPMPNLVEFDVPVLLQFNGHMETNSLRQYLPKDEFQLLKWMLHRHGIDELSRARLVGVMLKKAYQRSPDNFPLPLNGDSQEIAEEIRKLGVRLMFGRNPFDRVDPFAQKFEMLKRLRTNAVSQKCGKVKGQGDGEEEEEDGAEGDKGPAEPCRDDQQQLQPKQRPTVGSKQQNGPAAASGPSAQLALLKAVDFFPAGAESAEDWQRQQDEGEMLLTTREAAGEGGRLNGDLLSKFIALFNGTIHWKI